MKEKVEKYQTHRHTFSCNKKKQTITIKENEGHGRLDGLVKGPELRNIPLCRFKFPKFPLDQTKLVFGIPKDTDENIIKERNALKQTIKPFDLSSLLISQTNRKNI